MSTVGAAHPPVWHNHDWLRLWSGNAATALGGSMAGIAYPLVAFSLTGSVGAASVVASAGGLGFLATGPVAGLVVDRVDRRRLILAVDAVGLVSYAALGLLLWCGSEAFWPLVAVAAVTGARQGFSAPAHGAAVRRVVAPAQLPAALANQQAATAAAQMAGPPVGGLAYAAGPAFPFVASAVSYLLDLLLVLGVRTPLDVARTERVEMPGRSPLVADLLAGFRFLWAQGTLRVTIVFVVVINLCIGIFSIGLNLRLVSGGVAPVLIGAVDAATSAGALVGALVAGRVVERVPLGRLVWSGAGILALTWVPLSFTGTCVPAVAALSFCMILAIPAVNAGLMGYLQAITPDEVQGRVLSAGYVLGAAAQPLGPLLAGWLLTTAGPVVAGLVPAALALAVSLLLATREGIRRLGTPDTW